VIKYILFSCTLRSLKTPNIAIVHLLVFCTLHSLKIPNIHKSQWFRDSMDSIATFDKISELKWPREVVRGDPPRVISPYIEITLRRSVDFCRVVPRVPFWTIQEFCSTGATKTIIIRGQLMSHGCQ
jgi:hypothetical protein